MPHRNQSIRESLIFFGFGTLAIKKRSEKCYKLHLKELNCLSQQPCYLEAPNLSWRTLASGAHFPTEAVSLFCFTAGCLNAAKQANNQANRTKVRDFARDLKSAQQRQTKWKWGWRNESNVLKEGNITSTVASLCCSAYASSLLLIMQTLCGSFQGQITSKEK